tara:strand:- start:164956 stop:166089 length:1134 start_codon:yes stop_codon:yes gene_type:complete
VSNKFSLCIQGNAANESEWSGTAYYCGKALENYGDVQYFDIKPNASKLVKALWRLKQTLQGKSIFGYQYSKKELEQLNNQISDQYTSGTLISFNQLLPYSGHFEKLVYYIDCTLEELFNSPTYSIKLSEARKKELIEIEKKNYQKADAVMIMGSWLRDSLETSYGIEPKKIHHVLPGANMAQNSVLPKPLSKTLTIGFVAKDYKRKGLLYLVELAKQLQVLSIDVKLVLVGECPEEISQLPFVNYLGYIHKKKQPEKWIEFLQQCHFGALFSSDEALGISVLEFLAAGIPVMGYYHQGLKDTLIEGASVRAKLETPALVMALSIATVWNDEDNYDSMRKETTKASDYCTWNRASYTIYNTLKSEVYNQKERANVKED